MWYRGVEGGVERVVWSGWGEATTVQRMTPSQLCFKELRWLAVEVSQPATQMLAYRQPYLWTNTAKSSFRPLAGVCFTENMHKNTLRAGCAGIDVIR
jgi:hypothetical protein